MARRVKQLTTRAVATTVKVGRHADGGNLYLKVSKTGPTTVSKRWVFMYTTAGRQREAGFGSAATLSLAEARAKAAECRSMLAKGLGPSRRQAGRQRGGGGAQDIRPMRRRPYCFKAKRMAQRSARKPMGDHARNLLRADPRPSS
jgi:Arm DNA-binding domain